LKVDEKNLSDKSKSIEKEYEAKFINHCKEFDEKKKVLEEDLKTNLKMVKDVVEIKHRLGVYKGSYAQIHSEDAKTTVKVDIYIARQQHKSTEN